MFRSLFPSFEKPVAPPRYLNIEPQGRDFRGVGTVILLAASCGVALALWEPSHQVTSPFVTPSASRSAPAVASKPATQETTAAADVEDDQTTPTVKLSTLCSQRATARRDCAGVKALKDARLSAPDPVPAPAKESKPAVAAATASSASQPEAAPVVVPPAVAPAETPAVTQPEVPAAQPQKTASAPKAKRPRPAEEAPVERLVRVYDQVMPDGRRVPVYRRVGSGTLEIGTIVDGEYRSARRANLEPSPSGRYYGLQ